MVTNADTRRERMALTKHLAAATGVFVAVILLFHDTAWAIVSTWSESNAFNHGFLILPICVYLAWRQRAKAAETKVEPDFRGLLLVALSAAAWLVGKATGTLLIQEMSLVMMAQSIFLTIYGWPMWRTFMFPLLYMFFAVPVGIEIVPQLQAITAALAVSLIRDIGIPVFNDGNIISIPSGTFYVAEECSGVRFLTASIAVGALFAGITYRAWWRRALFMALAATVPIAANGFRAFGIIWLTYVTNNEIAHGVDHITYGWIFFTFVTFVILAIGASFREKIDTGSVASPASHQVARARTSKRAITAGASALLLGALAALFGADIDHPPRAEPPHLAMPLSDGAWQATNARRDPLPPVFAAPDIELDNSYVHDGSTVHLHIGYYLNNRRGAQIVSSEHEIGEGNGWIVVAAGTRPIDLGAEPVSVRFTRSVEKGSGYIIWYWYWIDGRFTGNPYLAKLLEAKVKLLGGDPKAAIIAIGADYADNASKAETTLGDFASTLGWLAPALSGETAH